MGRKQPTGVSDAKRLLKKLQEYSSAICRDLKMTKLDSYKAMRDDSANVGKDLGCSAAFVFMWAEGEIKSQERLDRALGR